ncbi:Delta24(24(1))-sterol reductase, partial [Phenoliferia sp. Uapishka_3]
MPPSDSIRSRKSLAPVDPITPSPIEPPSPAVQPRLRAKSDVDEDGIHHEYEFGGPPGVVGMMVFFPCLFYYLFICLTLNDGKFLKPIDASSLTGPNGWIEFAKNIASLVRIHAAPTKRAAALYFSLMALQLLLAFIMPGLKQQGLPVGQLGGRTLTYNCNAFSSLYATVLIVGTLHFTGVFNLADIIDLYGPLLTVASISGFALAAVVYVTGERYRMSGNLIYDYFMGSSLNPRIGSVDIKMWAEIRISWTLLFAIAMGAVAKQYQTYGYVSPNVALFAYGTGLYLNACAKGEHFIPQTWDMNFEKVRLANPTTSYKNADLDIHPPSSAGSSATGTSPEFPFPTPTPPSTWQPTIPLHTVTQPGSSPPYSSFSLAHIASSQTGTYIPRHTYPQIPGTVIENPQFIQTKRGRLLISGCWGVVRKPNYISDWIQALCWALSTGFGSKIPYFYPLFHLTMLLHRNARDDARCARKYGAEWIEYQRQVPYSFIPYVL